MNKQLFLYVAAAAVVVSAAAVFGGYYYRLAEADKVNHVCQEFYARNASTNNYTVEASYDSDGDGYGSCSVWQDGRLIVELECTTGFWFNPEKCRPMKLAR
jgi:hypothetical protein